MSEIASDIAVSPTTNMRAPYAAFEHTMNGFIRIAEVWVPTKDRLQLQLDDGLYGSLEELRAISERTRFGFGEGLPGKAWAARHPIVVADFQESWFAGAPAAAKA